MVQVAQGQRIGAAGYGPGKIIVISGDLYYNQIMKTISIRKRITAVFLAVVMMTAMLAGCQAKAAVVQRSEGSSRGTVFHSQN